MFVLVYIDNLKARCFNDKLTAVYVETTPVLSLTSIEEMTCLHIRGVVGLLNLRIINNSISASVRCLQTHNWSTLTQRIIWCRKLVMVNVVNGGVFEVCALFILLIKQAYIRM